MKYVLLLCLIGLSIDHCTGKTDASSNNVDEYQILNQGEKFNNSTRFKRGAAPSRPTRRGFTTFGSFFGAGREERLCNTRMTTARIRNVESNKTLDLVIMKETKDRNDEERSGLTVDYFEEYDLSKHGQVHGNERLRAYHFPYLSGKPGADSKLGIGWVDIPKRPTDKQPTLAITNGMNGCATVVMSLKNNRNTLRVYHLQSPGALGGLRWYNYIRRIRNHHNDVDNVISSFSWKDYAYDAQTEANFLSGRRGLQPEATILLHYDSGSQKWYYASQLNMRPLYSFDENNNKVRLEDMDDQYLHGKVYKTLYAQLSNQYNRPAPQYCNNFFPWI